MTNALPDSIRCMLVPLKDKLLLIPNTTVVEVIHFPKAIPAEHMPAYWVGYCSWRSQQLPIIDLDALLEHRAANTENVSHLCILKGINSPEELTLYALPCYAPPQLISIDTDTLSNVSESEHDWLFGQIEVGNKTALIPNIDTLELIIIKRLVAD